MAKALKKQVLGRGLSTILKDSKNKSKLISTRKLNSILEIDVGNIASRVSMKSGSGLSGNGPTNLGDMSISQAFLHSAREQLVKMGQRDGL